MFKAGVAVLLVVLTSCGTARHSSSSNGSAAVRAAAASARVEGAPAQYEILKDGRVTRAEYRDAIDQERVCDTSGGLAVTDPVVSPIDGLRLLYSVTPNGRSVFQFTKTAHACNVKYLPYVTVQYLGTHKALMDEPLRQHTAACLGSHGHRLRGRPLNAVEFLKAVGVPDRDDVLNCIEEGARKLYPRLTPIVVTF